MASFRFFTSYAHADASDDDLLRTFYSDLSVELKRITGAQNDEFLDTKNIVSGEEWRRSLEGALGSSRCFLAFYSPLYFASANCGKEVAAFQQRLRDFRSAGGATTTAPLLIGVLWESEYNIRIPDLIRDFQYGVPHFSEDPRKSDRDAINRTQQVRQLEGREGLRKIMQMKEAGSSEYTAAYIDIVTRYGAHIKAITGQYDLSNHAFTGDYRTLTPAFPARLSPTDAVVSTVTRGPKYVRVLFIVGRPGSFAGLNLRSNVAGYADVPELWQPFLPDADDEIGPIVVRAVGLEKMYPEPISATMSLDPTTLNQIIDTATRDHKVLVVIIDPWSVFIPDLKSNLEELDKRRNAYGSLFLCWNDRDPETAEKAAELEGELKDVFYQSSLENASLLSEIVLRSPRDLENQLRAQITLIKTRILNRLARQGQIRPLPAGTQLPTTPVPVS